MVQEKCLPWGNVVLDVSEDFRVRRLTVLIFFIFLEGSDHLEKMSVASLKISLLCLRVFQGNVHFLRMELPLGHTRQRRAFEPAMRSPKTRLPLLESKAFSPYPVCRFTKGIL